MHQERELESRVRQALRCPYCRDEVGRRLAVACARDGCGALYHRDCFEDCRSGYGGCAIYGCGSQESREVSAPGFALRVLRLVIAALLFSSRVARRVGSSEPGRRTVSWRRAVELLVPGATRRRNGRFLRRFRAREQARRERLAERTGLSLLRLASRRTTREHLRRRRWLERMSARSGLSVAWIGLTREVPPWALAVYVLMAGVMSFVAFAGDVIGWPGLASWWSDLVHGPFALGSPELSGLAFGVVTFVLVIVSAVLLTVPLSLVWQTLPVLSHALRAERAALARADGSYLVRLVRAKGSKDAQRSGA